MKIRQLFLAAGLIYSQVQAQNTLVFRHANIISGTSDKIQTNQTLLVRDGIIVSLYAEGGQLPKDATYIDVTGKYLMPTLFNMHGHLGIIKGNTNAAGNYTADNVRNQLRRYQQYGVGAVLSMGTEQPLLLPLRDSSRAGVLPGAIIYSALYGFGVADGAPPVAMGMTRVFRPETPEQARQQVDSLAALKPDVIKIWVDDFGGSMPKMKPEIYTAILQRAHQKGIRVAAHVYYLEDARKLVRLGLDIIAHSIRDKEVDEAFITQMKQHRVVYIPTLSLDEFAYAYEQTPAWVNDPFFRTSLEPGVYEMVTSAAYKQKVMNDPKTAKEKAALKTAMRNLVKLYRAGVMIALGTDSGAMPIRPQGFAEHQEMELMVQAGLTPGEVIEISTLNGARLLGTAHTQGSIETGKQADFIILDANPLSDIRNTHKINAVYLKGRQVSYGPSGAY